LRSGMRAHEPRPHPCWQSKTVQTSPCFARRALATVWPRWRNRGRVPRARTISRLARILARIRDRDEGHRIHCNGFPYSAIGNRRVPVRPVRKWNMIQLPFSAIGNRRVPVRPVRKWNKIQVPFLAIGNRRVPVRPVKKWNGIQLPYSIVNN
jgi:hypothetical protein